MTRIQVLLVVLACCLAVHVGVLQADFNASDPGVRPDPQNGPKSAGGMISGLTPAEQALFAAGLEDFEAADNIASGLGPRMNLDSCQSCHVAPAVGGSSPAVNPQVAFATAFGAKNSVPFFVKSDGPVREARFKSYPDGTPDGGVHALFVISGRKDSTGDASACTIKQEDFDAQGQKGNVVFRIPTPVFGAGLIESIPDSAIASNLAATANGRTQLGIGGRTNRRPTGSPNTSGNDGTMTRFGWKAQNKWLLIFAGEAYNVEQGITNEVFSQERDETTSCQFATVPNDTTKAGGTTAAGTLSGPEKFAAFMRFLAPPTPSTGPGSPLSLANGKNLFQKVGCAFCHTPTLYTGNTTVAALRTKPVNLYSDLALHAMGAGLADDVSQGAANGDEFRTAPLWGVGQRLFFLHDGRAKDLITAIAAHKSAGNNKYQASEANQVVDNFFQLNQSQQQDVLNFLRSL
ncbi:MAG TPA: di-heme oxidoredictase family protein [Candidatus Acidoferrales bacterium]|nr:di-heme oxidoredictase family protein [Candidatus Acidoferrales bacterium]